MTNRRIYHSRWRHGAGYVLIVALLVRIVAVALVAPWNEGKECAFEHADIARHLVAGEGFRFNFFGFPDQPVLTSQQAPWVATILAGAYFVLGVESPSAFLAVIGLQVLAGALAAFAVTKALEIISSSRTAFVSGMGVAIYPPFVLACAHIQAVPWNLAFLAGAILGIAQCRAGSRCVGPGTFTVSASLAWHNDPIIGAAASSLLLALVPFGVLLGRRDFLHPWQYVRQPFAMAFCLMLTLLPWTVRNYAVHGRILAMKSSFGYVLWQGNTAPSHGTDKLPLASTTGDASPWSPRLAWKNAVGERARAVSVDKTLPPAFVHHLATLPAEIDRMDAFASLIRAELAQRPSQYLEKCLLRLRQWIWFDETNPRSLSAAYRMGYILLMSLAAVGIVLDPRGCRGIVILLGPAGVLTLTHVLLITSARFRLPLELLLVPPAAVGVLACVQLFIRMRIRLHEPLRAPRLSVS